MESGESPDPARHGRDGKEAGPSMCNQCRQTEELEDGIEGSLGALGVALYSTISSRLVILVKAALSKPCIYFVSS